MEQILKVVVGSKMHGLDTPSSDIDVRTITMLPLVEVLSPFRKDEVKVGGGDDDCESWELRHLVKHAVKGNGTIYEVLWSPLILEADAIGRKLVEIRSLFLDSEAIRAAHVGYASAQLKRYLNRLEREPAAIHEPTWRKRLPKATVAAYRILHQAKQLLRTGTFCARVEDYNPLFARELFAIKEHSLMDAPESVIKEFCTTHAHRIENLIQEVNIVFDMEVEKGNVYKPDIEGIKNFLYWAYTLYQRERLSHAIG